MGVTRVPAASPRGDPAPGPAPGGERTGKPAMKSGQEPSALPPGYKRIYSISPRPGSALAPAPLGRRHAGNARARAFVAGFRSLSPNMVPGMESWSAAGPGAPGGSVWGGAGLRAPLTSPSRRPPFSTRSGSPRGSALVPHRASPSLRPQPLVSPAAGGQGRRGGSPGWERQPPARGCCSPGWAPCTCDLLLPG